MRPLLPRRRSVSILALLAAFLSTSSAAQPPRPADPALPPRQREVLIEAARDPQLSEWQREYMLGLAGGAAKVEPPDRLAPMRGPMQRTQVTADEGVWNELVKTQRAGHTAIYDPVRDRMV
ncbi:MAG: hypothetical protein E6K81_16775, partial [Candidatus Eisenbacteria bacterium]